MNLSPHFTLLEMTRSETAVRHGINNTPNAIQIKKLKALCENVLEPIRDLIGLPINIHSGFRNPTVNSLVGGSINSQHKKGEAADFSVENKTPQELFDIIRASNIPFDQIIQEFNEWVHISFRNANRHDQLIASKNDNNVTVFTRV